MKILIEGEKYNIELLNEVFDDPKFFIQEGATGTMNCVGYYCSYEKNKIVYILPKVFIKDGKAFNLSPTDLFYFDLQMSIKHGADFVWVRQLLIYFYNSVSEFRKRYRSTIITDTSQTFELNSNLSLHEYTYLDLVLSFTNFYRKNKNTILYHHIDFISNQANKARWEKTIRCTTPILLTNKSPLYNEVRNKKKKVNDEEALVCYFFSILNHFKKEHELPIVIDKSYSLIVGRQFENLQNTGLSKLRKIKHKYFADTLKRMYQLCELYFSKTDTGSSKRKREEFITVRNYNIVFEDMIDKLFTDQLYKETTDDVSIDKLKHNKDGKIIDHIFEYQSVIDTTNVFYIGDSKYYKTNAEADALSTYKQFTYAKNVIQFNIDLFNKGKGYPRLRYRDALTEGYNISPNFFIYGHLYDRSDFDDPLLESYSIPKKSYHFEERLFDRDTLFILQYRINFLYVLKAYTTSNTLGSISFRKNTKEKFRNEFLAYFNTVYSCGFTIYEREFEEGAANFINENFKALNGKSITINTNTLLVAIHQKDEENIALRELIKEFKIKKLI
jgi:hypothetical protein